MPSVARESADTNARYHVPSLIRALQIFEFLATEVEPMGVSEISARLGLPKNSVFRILTTLADYGYVHREPEQKNYILSRKLLALGHMAVDGLSLVEKALGPMRALCESTLESVLIGVLSGTQGVVLEQIPSPQPIKVLVELGHRFPLHSAAPGKAILAFLPPPQREAVLQKIKFTRYTTRTITRKADYIAELDRVRELGYALDLGEEVEEIHCIAAPILGRRGEPVAAIWVTGPRTRLTEGRFEIVRRAVVAQAAIISERVGGDRPGPVSAPKN